MWSSIYTHTHMYAYTEALLSVYECIYLQKTKDNAKFYRAKWNINKCWWLFPT